MKKGRFLWSAHRITEKQKARKARNIKEKQLKNSRNTDLKLSVLLGQIVLQIVVSKQHRTMMQKSMVWDYL